MVSPGVSILVTILVLVQFLMSSIQNNNTRVLLGRLLGRNGTHR